MRLLSFFWAQKKTDYKKSALKKLLICNCYFADVTKNTIKPTLIIAFKIGLLIKQIIRIKNSNIKRITIIETNISLPLSNSFNKYLNRLYPIQHPIINKRSAIKKYKIAILLSYIRSSI